MIIPGYPNYSISLIGEVRSFSSKKKGSLLKLHIDKDGYLIAVLSNNAKPKKFKVHRLVAQAFIPNVNNLPEVNHVDGDKSNNCIQNLEWVTMQKNQSHAWNTGLKFKKLTLEEVREIKSLIGTKTNTEIAEMYGLNQSSISNIKTGKSWKDI